ncbi:MAG: acetyl-CoA carboxylase biotin carboxyl carrier protein subunit [Crocinitomicaceae bacterium]
MENVIKTIEFDSLLQNAAVTHLGKGVYQLNSGNKTEIIEVLAIDFDLKTMQIRHDHYIHDIIFKNNLDLVLDSMGIKRAAENLNLDVKAPMPGKVIDVNVKEGDAILKGDAILILEAMKMENVLKAENDCTIKKILVGASESVEKNQILVELEAN